MTDNRDLEPIVVNGSTRALPDDAPSALSRRSFFTAAGALGLGGSALLGTKGVRAQSTDWLQAGNNNRVIELQETASFPDTGSVRIDYYGHCALKITSPGGATVLFDPWRDDPSGAWGMWFRNEFPETLVDITMSTHTHFDHDAIFRPRSTMVLDRMVGEFAFADLKITGFADKHACVAPGWYKWTDAIAELPQIENPLATSRDSAGESPSLRPIARTAKNVPRTVAISTNNTGSPSAEMSPRESRRPSRTIPARSKVLAAKESPGAVSAVTRPRFPITAPPTTDATMSGTDPVALCTREAAKTPSATSTRPGTG